MLHGRTRSGVRGPMLLAIALVAASCLLLTVAGEALASPPLGRAPEVETITGQIVATTEVGESLICSSGSWGGEVTEFKYQWLRDGLPIHSATTNLYEVQAADAGHSLSCEVTAESPEGNGQVESSNSVKIVGGEPQQYPPELSGKHPSVSPSGSASVGAALTCEPGQWSGDPTPTFTYEWLSEKETKVGEGASYTVKATDEGHSLSCEVTASNSAGTKSALSENSVPVAGKPPHLEGGSIPAVFGVREVGAELTCYEGQWNGGPTFTYEWLSAATEAGSKKVIAGQTGSTYIVESSQSSRYISCKVTAKNTSGTASAESAAVLILGSKPSVKEPPRISPSGNTIVGHTLTCEQGTWNGSPAPTFEYQWLLGEAHTPIPMATAAKYKATIEDVGQTLTCQVTAHNTLGGASATSQSVLVLEEGVHEEPLTNTEPPEISGEAVVSGTLTCSDGQWQPAATSYSFEWFRDEHGSEVPVASGETYTVQSADVNFSLSCKVRAFNSEGSGEAKSAGRQILGSAPKVISVPKLSGKPVVGETLTCSSGEWTGSPAPTYKYAWLREGSSTGISQSSYVLSTADEGYEISCEVTAENGIGLPATAASASTYVPGNPPHNIGAPKVSGTAAPNHVLKCSEGEWTGKPALTSASYSYEWIVENSSVPGVTGDEYTISTSDEGRSIGCKVTATNREGKAEATSNMVHVPGKPPQIVGVAPEIVGTAAVGQQLSCERGVWEGKPPPTFAYQWLLDEVPITGATGRTLIVEPEDEGHLLTCTVKAVNGEGSYEVDTQGVAVPYSAIKTVPKTETYDPPPKPTPRVTISEIQASLAAQLPRAQRGARVASVLKGGVFSFSFTSLTVGTLQIFWYQVPKGAHVSSGKAKPVLVASAKSTFSGATKEPVKLRLTAAGRRLLEQHKRTKLTVKAEFKTAKGAVATWIGTIVMSG